MAHEALNVSTILGAIAGTHASVLGGLTEKHAITMLSGSVRPSMSTDLQVMIAHLGQTLFHRDISSIRNWLAAEIRARSPRLSFRRCTLSGKCCVPTRCRILSATGMGFAFARDPVAFCPIRRPARISPAESRSPSGLAYVCVSNDPGRKIQAFRGDEIWIVSCLDQRLDCSMVRNILFSHVRL